MQQRSVAGIESGIIWYVSEPLGAQASLFHLQCNEKVFCSQQGKLQHTMWIQNSRGPKWEHSRCMSRLSEWPPVCYCPNSVRVSLSVCLWQSWPVCLSVFPSDFFHPPWRLSNKPSGQINSSLIQLDSLSVSDCLFTWSQCQPLCHFISVSLVPQHVCPFSSKELNIWLSPAVFSLICTFSVNSKCVWSVCQDGLSPPSPQTLF